MKRILLFSMVCMLIFTSAVSAAGPVIGDKILIDTSYTKGIVVNLDDWFATHRLESGQPTRGDKLFESPRSQVVLVTNKGPLIGLHYHKSADEIVFVYKGQGEMYIDGQWVPVKAGDIHVNPRGVIQATRVVGDDEMLVFSIFTPPQAGGNDKVMLDTVVPSVEGQVVGDDALIDTSYDKGFVISLNAWYATHRLTPGQATRGDKVYESPRSQLVLVTNRGPLIGLHYHQTADEIVFVYKGKGEMYIDGQWVPVNAGDIHVNPRGVIHATRVVGDEDMLVFSVFTPPQANGNDKVMLNK